MLRTILNEIIDLATFLGQSLILISGILVCTALSVLIGLSLLGQPDQGRELFFSIMASEGLYVQADLQASFALLNWISLFLIVIYIPAMRINSYLQDLKLKVLLSNP